MKARIDATRCQGHGQCVFLCPEVFAADAQGMGTVVRADVPVASEDDARRAEGSCPERAIELSS